MDHIRNQQATDILEAMERLNKAGYRVETTYDDREDTDDDQRHVALAAHMSRLDGDMGIARKATLRDALAHLIQILWV